MATPLVDTARPIKISLPKDLSAVGVTELPPVETPERFIVQSPYTEPEHLLDLETLNFENSVVARALRSLTNIRDDYATCSYTDAFNWTEVLDEVKRLVRTSGQSFKETSFYIVAFRSQIKPSTDYAHLGDMDKAAHAEAIASGGFLRYWCGEPDQELRNLATCLWRTREDAIAGGKGPAHRTAAGATRNMYAFWKIDQHRLTIRDNVESWEFTPWS